MRKLYAAFWFCVSFVLAGLSLYVFSTQQAYDKDLPYNGIIEVYFSPKGGITDVLVKMISSAKSTIRIQAYGFTSEPIVNALLDARKKKVSVQIILDKRSSSSEIKWMNMLVDAGALVYLDGKHAIAHNKIMLVDDKDMFTGSFNFTKSAEERNAENAEIYRNNPEMVKYFIENFELHKSHSILYKKESEK